MSSLELSFGQIKQGTFGPSAAVLLKHADLSEDDDDITLHQALFDKGLKKIKIKTVGHDAVKR